MSIVTVDLPAELLARIDAAAEADDRSRSAIVRRALAQALADDSASKAEAWRRFKSVQSPT